MNFPLQISSPQKEGVLQVSKWLKIQVLLDLDEMQDLLKILDPVFFVSASQPVQAKEIVIEPKIFLEKYAQYISLLKQGLIPPNEEFRRFFSCGLSNDLESFYALATHGDRFLVKPKMPVVQCQAHHFFYSPLDEKFHPMVLSKDSVSWGIQFSYPQLFQDPATHQVVKVGKTFSNSALFATLQKWIRNFTMPTPFIVQNKRTNSSIRIGKKSLSWIKSHPQLKQKEINVLG